MQSEVKAGESEGREGERELQCGWELSLVPIRSACLPGLHDMRSRPHPP